MDTHDPYKAGFAEAEDILLEQAHEASYLDAVATSKYDRLVQERESENQAALVPASAYSRNYSNKRIGYCLLPQ